MTILRVWNEVLNCWMHEVQLHGVSFDTSRHRDELEEKYPEAKPSGAVVCGDNIYPENS